MIHESSSGSGTMAAAWTRWSDGCGRTDGSHENGLSGNAMAAALFIHSVARWVTDGMIHENCAGSNAAAAAPTKWSDGRGRTDGRDP